MTETLSQTGKARPSPAFRASRTLLGRVRRDQRPAASPADKQRSSESLAESAATLALAETWGWS
ncbi:MAG TPA: hypothetical protein VFC51_11705 [Chloroflexota bacterium]|nr:hypothetical protein [Chloroflexota bacterium]